MKIPNSFLRHEFNFNLILRSCKPSCRHTLKKKKTKSCNREPPDKMVSPTIFGQRALVDIISVSAGNLLRLIKT